MSQVKILVFIPVGDTCEANAWIPKLLNDESYRINFLLIYYGDDTKFRERFVSDRVKIIHDKSPSKFEKFYKYVTSGEIEIDKYDLFWIADDDIRISVESALNLFENFCAYNLEIAQPGCLGFAMGKQLVRRNQKYKIRFTNYVDGMAPLFGKKALTLCLKTFQNCQSGRGVDHVWAALLGNPANKIAIIDNSLMYHMNPSGSNYSRFEKSIDEQYEKIKDVYLDQINHFYEWDQRIVHNSIRSDQATFMSIFNPLINKFCELREIGIIRISSFIFVKVKTKFSKNRQ